ncbi:MAG: DOPA 4,5-dioxygenase family protein [Pseudomonadota bacterium]
MTELETSAITGYHAHVYYDAATKPTAEAVREGLAPFDVALGRWHDNPIGPHPCGSYQVAFAPESFSQVVPWLALNRQGLTVFIHPETGQELEDHRDRALWLGPQRELKLEIFD